MSGTRARWSRFIRGPMVALALAAAVATLLSGCGGAMGGTKPFVVAIGPDAVAGAKHRVELGTVTVAADANDLRATGTYHVGKFDEEDREILRRSFADTLSKSSWPSGSGDAWQLHVHLRRYLVAHSNNDGGVLACVAWALTTADGRPIHTDQFYASVAADDAASGERTLGGIKNQLNRSVVERIVRSAAAVAAAPDPAHSHPRIAVAQTYDTIQEAAAGLPKRLVSLMGLPAIATRKVDWAEVDPPGEVDWKALLATR
jgi:hypothetical protein